MATNRTSPKKGKVVDIPDATITIGTATNGAEQASIAFTVATTPATGGPVQRYTAISNPGSITRSATSSPIVVTGLTAGTAYTFQVAATNATGSGVYSSASNSVTPTVNSLAADFLVIAGGGGTANAFSYYAGGAGAGGLRSSVSPTGGGASAESALNLIIGTSYTIAVGNGGAFGNGTSGSSGGNSSISGTGITTITSTGGGFSSYASGANPPAGGTGGSGGGAGSTNGSPYSAAGGAGTTGQGYAGGAAQSTDAGGSGGGGGAGGIGGTGTGSASGNGGAGVSNSITGTAVTYAAGGAGVRGFYNNTSGTQASGWSRSANLGMGASAVGGSVDANANGGSGVVILRALQAAASTTGSPTYTTSGSYHIYKFNGNGTITY